MSLGLLPPNFDFRHIDLYEKALSANAALAELNGLVLSLPNYELLLQPLTAREAVASSEIENIRTTTLELLQAELMAPSELSPEQKEILSYKQALQKGYELVNASHKLGLEEILAIQAQIAPDKAGLRDRQVFIGSRDGRVVYMPPEASQLRVFLRNWEDYVSRDNQIDALIDMAIGHYQFESIHPFLDGNGRAGRILLVLHLVLKSKLRYPVLFLSGHILKFKPYYYELFKKVELENDWLSWVMFFLNGVELQARETAQRVLEIKELESQMRPVLKAQLPKLDSQDLVNYFFAKAFYTQGNMSKQLGITRQTAGKYLEKLMNAGYLQQRRAGREKLFFIPRFVQILS